jgi:hypothetical protein
MQNRADGLVAHMTDQIRQMRNLQARARDDRDTLKLSCIDNQLVVGNAVLRISESERTSLHAAVRSNSSANAATAHGRIAALAADCDAASRAAGTCVGSKTAVAFGSKASVGHHPTKALSVVVRRPYLLDDPTDDCNVMGLQACQSQPLEYVAWASPFSPN